MRYILHASCLLPLLLSSLPLAENHPLHSPRASADLAFHVLDTLETLLESAAAARTLDIHSTTARPEPLAAPSS